MTILEAQLEIDTNIHNGTKGQSVSELDRLLRAVPTEENALQREKRRKITSKLTRDIKSIGKPYSPRMPKQFARWFKQYKRTQTFAIWLKTHGYREGLTEHCCAEQVWEVLPDEPTNNGFQELTKTWWYRQTEISKLKEQKKEWEIRKLEADQENSSRKLRQSIKTNPYAPEPNTQLSTIPQKDPSIETRSILPIGFSERRAMRVDPKDEDPRILEQEIKDLRDRVSEHTMEELSLLNECVDSNKKVVNSSTIDWRNTYAIVDYENLAKSIEEMSFVQDPNTIPIEIWTHDMLRDWFGRNFRTRTENRDPKLVRVIRRRRMYERYNKYLCEFSSIEEKNVHPFKSWQLAVDLVGNSKYKKKIREFDDTCRTIAADTKKEYLGNMEKLLQHVEEQMREKLLDRLRQHVETNLRILQLEEGDLVDKRPSPEDHKLRKHTIGEIKSLCRDKKRIVDREEFEQQYRKLRNKWYDDPEYALRIPVDTDEQEKYDIEEQIRAQGGKVPENPLLKNTEEGLLVKQLSE
jgi:hypothetical protein